MDTLIYRTVCVVVNINDICNVSKILKFVLFADDTNILNSDANVKKLNNVVNTELDKLNTWFIINKLSYLIKVTVYVPLDPNANMYEIVFEQILRHIVYRLMV